MRMDTVFPKNNVAMVPLSKNISGYQEIEFAIPGEVFRHERRDSRQNCLSVGHDRIIHRGWKVPSPLPAMTDTALLSPSLAVLGSLSKVNARSSLPLPAKSPAKMFPGLSPTG